LAEAESEQFLAAVLFADISGFTVLTERLAGTGPGGVEELPSC
jgi:class 3 adenylate cyclase